ncbi:MAG TPA: ABC transporter ATP-binding protein [Phycisphaerales bacterium]|nr:ABC transporter ATP-binding protein [Phycisphaerales bacterium]
MPARPLSSKLQFERFLQKVRTRRRAATPAAEPAPGAPAPALADEKEEKKRQRHRSFPTIVREFWRLLRGHHLTIILSLLTLSAATGLNLLQPLATKIAFDYILMDNPGPAGLPAWLGLPRDRLRLLAILGAALIVVALLAVAIGMWGRTQMTWITKRVQVNLRRLLFDHAVRLPLNRVYQLKSGGVASILREDAGQAGDLCFSLIYNPWRAIVQLTGTLVVLALTDWRMLLGGLALIPSVWLSHRTWISRIRPVFREIRAMRSGIDAHATEAFGGMRIVRGFGRERGEAGRFVRSGHLMARQEMLVWWWSRVVDVAWALMIPTASAAVLVYGGWQVLRGNLTIGDVMMFSAYLFMLLGPLDVLVATATGIQTNLAALDRVLDLLAEPREFETVGAASGPASPPLLEVDPARVRGHIALRKVSFWYPGHDAVVLDGVSLDVPAGATVALVGPSGSGKTTLCNLVARFYDPTAGAIELDGTDLRAIDVASYRRLLGIVEQDVFLFDGTVEENIAYSRPQAGPSDVEAAARAANAHEFIVALERGYRTLIGERGVRLSGGQKQRLAIARAVLADPRILILDEATSNLDSESEALIQTSLRRLMRGRTCLVIAHRLSTIRHADLIVVMERGRIIERGTHDELRAAEGRYWEMLMRQIHAHTEPVGGHGPGAANGVVAPHAAPPARP